jgi:molybdopterin synthase catalytic subunit
MASTPVTDPRVRLVSLTAEPLDPAATLAAVGDVSAGGNVLFLGTVRGITAGSPTTRLEYQAHEPLARAVLERLSAEAADRFGLVAVAVTHRLGEVDPAEASVAVATSAAHRREAFAGAEWLMERIKREVPIWKCDHRPDGGHDWVHGELRPGGGE